MVAIAKEPTPTSTAAAAFYEIRTKDIEASPLNYRKTFHGLEELGADIKTNGLRVPIKVRPNPRKTTKWELVYGERRWRAACEAGVEDLPALIQSLSDEEVVREQLVENGSRADVHPLEEADLFKRMVDVHGYDRQAIADMIGKSLSHVHARMKLCELKGPQARLAFFDDKISASIALLAARIPDGKLQDAFVKEVIAGPDRSDRQLVHGEWVDAKRPMSYREAQIHAQQNYMLRLDQAPFPIADANLVKGVGACTGCLFRTGNQRELFDDVKSADVCTNLPCFAKKRDAQFAIESKQHAAAGGTVLTVAESKKLFQQRDYDDSVFLPWNSKYKEADEPAPYEIDKKRRKWSDLFGGEDKVPVVLAKDPNGEMWKLVDVAKAKKELEKAGAIPKAKAAKSTSSRSSTPAKPKGPSLEELTETKTQKKVIAALVEKLDAKAAQHDIAFWRWFAALQLEACYEAGHVLKRTRNYDGAHSTLAATLLKGAKSAADYRKLALEAVIADRIGMDYGGKDAIDKETKEACKLFKVDWEELASDAAEEAKKIVEDSKAKKSATAKKGKAKS